MSTALPCRSRRSRGLPVESVSLSGGAGFGGLAIAPWKAVDLACTTGPEDFLEDESPQPPTSASTATTKTGVSKRGREVMSGAYEARVKHGLGGTRRTARRFARLPFERWPRSSRITGGSVTSARLRSPPAPTPTAP